MIAAEGNGWEWAETWAHLGSRHTGGGTGVREQLSQTTSWSLNENKVLQSLACLAFRHDLPKDTAGVLVFQTETLSWTPMILVLLILLLGVVRGKTWNDPNIKNVHKIVSHISEQERQHRGQLEFYLQHYIRASEPASMIPEHRPKNKRKRTRAVFRKQNKNSQQVGLLVDTKSIFETSGPSLP